MLRNTTQPILRKLVRPASVKPIYHSATCNTISTSRIHSLSRHRPRAITAPNLRPVTLSALRFATKPEPPFDKIDSDAERVVLEKQIEPDPKHVSPTSSVRHVLEGSQAPEQVKGNMGGVAGDFQTIKETFELNQVPKESLYIGAAGVLPYLATSVSTVYLAWDINHAQGAGNGYLFSPELAHEILSYLEPIQVGYGAVIISFLGAIHWGLEYAGYGGKHSYRRYAIGVVAPAIAWPTMLIPYEYALITQFLAFNYLYFVDARATTRGWAPPWYSTYRFVLTFVVGASIVLSLIGRSQIAEQGRRLATPSEHMKALKDKEWENLEKEERERIQAIRAADKKAAQDKDKDVDDKADKDNDKDDDTDKDDEADKKDDTKDNEKKDEKK